MDLDGPHMVLPPGQNRGAHFVYHQGYAEHDPLPLIESLAPPLTLTLHQVDSGAVRADPRQG